MDFLDCLSERDRDRLLASATTARLARGELLLRRGERGGDLFRVAEGELEVVDTRSQPVIVLDVLGPGALVGEMSFVQDCVRSADVRATNGAICQRWERGSLTRLLEKEPQLAAGFYRALATMVVERHRATTTSAVTGAVGGGQGIPRGPTNEEAVADGHALAQALQTRLMELEPLFRRDRVSAERDLGVALRNFTAALGEALARMSEVDGRLAGEVVRRELHPYTTRSHLGELARERESSGDGSLALMHHILHNRAGGDGPMGEVLDHWLLSSPTTRGLRERRALAVQEVMGALPPDPPLRMLVVNVSGGLVPAVFEQLGGRMPGEITCIDSDRAALSSIELAAASRPGALRARLIEDDLVRLCLGRSPMRFAPQHIVVLDGLLEYLPERVAAAALRWARGLLAPDGVAICTSLLPSADEALYRFLLSWPTVRRSAAATARLLGAAGFSSIRVHEAAGVGAVAIGR